MNHFPHNLTPRQFLGLLEPDGPLAAARVVSFDVFDTLLLRTVPSRTVTLAVAAWLETELSRRGVAPVMPILHAREAAYRETSRRLSAAGRDADCTLEEFIPAWLRAVAGRDDPRFAELAVSLWEYELRCEHLLTRPDRPLLAQVARLRHSGRRVIYTSDMILGKKGVDELFARHGYAGLFDEGYVSSDHRAFKWSGLLFRTVLQREGVAPGEMVHIGDNPSSDGRVPRRLGISSAVLADRDGPLRGAIKDWLALTSPAEDDPRAALLELCRRFDNGAFTADEAFGYESIGPMFCVFVHALIERSRRNGVERLYFVSRDAYLFYLIYQRFVADWGLQESAPQPIYFCMSRAALFPATRRELRADDFLGWIGQRPEVETLRSCLRRYGFDEQTLDAAARRHANLRFDAPYAEAEAARSDVEDLLRDEELNLQVARNGADARSALGSYLSRIGMFDCARAGLADIGWTGGSQRMLADCFADDPRFPELFGYYFALTSEARGRETDRSHMEGIFADQRRPEFCAYSVFSFLHGLESVCPAPHATVTGYLPGGAVRLMSSEHPVRAAERRNDLPVAAIQQGALRFADSYATLAGLLRTSADSALPHARFCAARLSRAPRPDEARRILSLQFSESFGHTQATRIGEDLPGPDDGLHARIGALLRKSYRHADWGRGVIALYRLPLLGFAYSAGGALKLLRHADAAPPHPRADMLAPRSHSASSSRQPWKPDAAYRIFMDDLAQRHRTLAAEATADRSLVMAGRPPLESVLRQVEMGAARRMINSAALLMGMPAYTDDAPGLTGAPHIDLPAATWGRLKNLLRRLQSGRRRTP